MSEIRHCLRNLIELCNPKHGTEFDLELAEGLLDVAMEGRLKIIFDNGAIYFQQSEVNQTPKESVNK